MPYSRKNMGGRCPELIWVKIKIEHKIPNLGKEKGVLGGTERQTMLWVRDWKTLSASTLRGLLLQEWFYVSRT